MRSARRCPACLPWSSGTTRISRGASPTLGPDVQDVFVERINPDNPNQYEVNGPWTDMQIVPEEIMVKGEKEPVAVGRAGDPSRPTGLGCELASADRRSR